MIQCARGEGLSAENEGDTKRRKERQDCTVNCLRTTKKERREKAIGRGEAELGIMMGWMGWGGLSRVFAWTIHHQQRLIALLC